MASEVLSIYGSWDLTQPVSSPRSNLYSLKPIGVGTPEVESLTGYVARLADAHCVSPGDLIAHKCGSLVKQTGGKSYLHQVAGSSEVLNGIGQMASDFAQAFNQLTLRQDLQHLTLLQWAAVLPAKGLLRRFRAWCPSCYDQWRESKEKIYEPLLWTLDVVSICPKHHVHLINQCPQCKRQLPSLAWHSRPGYCSKCQQWLGFSTNTVEPSNEKTGSDELEGHTWIAQNLGELLTYTPRLLDPVKRGNVARAFSVCIDHTTEGNTAEFCRRLGFLKSAVSQWRSSKALPQLSVLLKVCYTLNVPLINFLLDPESLDQRRISITSSSKLRAKPQQPKRQLEIRESLEAVLEEEPPPTMEVVAQRLGYSARSIRRRFPELCSRISSRYLSHRDSLRKAKIEECCQEVRQVAIMLYNQGIEPTRSQVAQFLKKPAYFRDPIVTAALDNVRVELGVG